MRNGEDYTFNEWTKIVNTNLSVPVFLVKELRPIMSEGGSILLQAPTQDSRLIPHPWCMVSPNPPFISLPNLW